MFDANSPIMTASLVFANKQIFFSLLPVVIGPAIWAAGLLFVRLSRLRSDSLQASKMLDAVKGPSDFAKQLDSFDTVIGSMHSLSNSWRQFRKSLLLPKNDSATTVIRRLTDTSIFFSGEKTGPASCRFYSELAIKLTLSFAILFAACSLAAGVFLSISGLDFQVAGTETQVFGAFQHGFLQSSVAAVTLFILTGVVTSILLQNFRHLAERSQERALSSFVEKLDQLIEPISSTMVAYEQIQEVKRQSHYLSIIEKRLTSLEGNMVKTVQLGTISTKKPPASQKNSSRLAIPPSLRSEIAKFRDPLENLSESPRPSPTVNPALKSANVVPTEDDRFIPSTQLSQDISVVENEDN